MPFVVLFCRVIFYYYCVFIYNCMCSSCIQIELNDNSVKLWDYQAVLFNFNIREGFYACATFAL